MRKNILFEIIGLDNDDSRTRVESEIEKLPGVGKTIVDPYSGVCMVKYDDAGTTDDTIIDAIKQLGFDIRQRPASKVPAVKERVYSVNGMHCPSCEILIEKKLLKEAGVKAVEATTNKGQVLIEYIGQQPSVEKLNSLFAADNYTFNDSQPAKDAGGGRTGKKQSTKSKPNGSRKLADVFVVAGASLVFIAAFIGLHKSGLSALVSVNAASALPMFIIFGLLAGFSSCAALIGGIILSMAKQWSDNYGRQESTYKRLQPHLLFNGGRLVSYGALGAVLGGVGKAFQLSASFSSMLVIGISIMMFFLALQMLGVRSFQRFQLRLPKFITRYIADEANFQGRYMPILMGAASFFLPCGFTITAQGLALASGSIWQGSLIMLFFAIGTLPALLGIGLSSVAFTKKPHMAARFLKIAGIVVLFFAIFNINAQLNVLGISSLDDISLTPSREAIASEDGLPPIVNGQQIIKMDASSYEYRPNYFKVKAGIPVKWEITDTGTSGWY